MPKFPNLDWKSPSYGGLTPSPIDWAKMAAFIDGEGSILINTRGNRKGYASFVSGFYLRLMVANTDVRLPVWLKQIFGGTFKQSNTQYVYKGRSCKIAWHWGTASNRAAWILFNCMPYFVMKMEQAEIGIKLQESLSRGFHGHQLSDETVEERRGLKKRLLILKARGIEPSPEQQERIAEVS